MALTHDEVNHLVAFLIAWYKHTRRPIPHGLAPYSGHVGVVKRRMICVYQKANGLRVTGEFDTATQRHLTPPDPRAAKAAKSMAYGAWSVAHHGSFTYAQDRPVHDPSPPDLYSLPRRRDCSDWLKDAARAGGFNELDGDGMFYGNTDSILAHARAHGRLRSIAQLRQADAIIFTGPGHAVLVTGPHATDPAGVRWLASDGHQGAPEYVTLAQEIASHHGPYYGIAVD